MCFPQTDPSVWDPCPPVFLMLESFYFQEDLAWAFPKNSPYFEVINHQLKLISESGLMDKIVRKQVISFPMKNIEIILFRFE